VIWWVIGPWIVFTIGAYVSDRYADADPEEDEDLVWVERRIATVHNIEPINADAAEQKREYLVRLYRVRREILRRGDR